jgi:imidazolonepropionase-like amidohydrolase
MRGALLAAVALSAFASSAALAQPTAIVGGRVVTNGPAGIIENGVVVIDGDRIAAVGGADLPIPDGATRIDAAGKWVTPGLFAAYGEVGIVEVDEESSTDDRAAAPGSPFSIALAAADAFNPLAENVEVARRDGITRIALSPGSAIGLFGGRGAIVDTSGQPDSVTLEPAFIAAALTRDRVALAGGARAAAYAMLEAALEDAADYPDLAKDPDGQVLSAPDAEALGAAIRGELPLLVEADRASDLRRLAELETTYRDLRLVIVGGAEAHLAADALADHEIPVVLDPSRNLPYTFDRLASTAETAARLEAAGVDFAIASLDDPYGNPGYLTQFAGVAVAYGLSWDKAFDAVTGAPARIYGLDAAVGSLEPDKAADVVIWDGDPLEVMSGVERVFIAGAEREASSRQSDLRDRYLGAEDPARPRAYRGE